MLPNCAEMILWCLYRGRRWKRRGNSQRTKRSMRGRKRPRRICGVWQCGAVARRRALSSSIQVVVRAFGVPTLGVIPYLPDLHIADEDAVPLESRRGPSGNLTAGQLDIAVIQLPHIANFDEFDALSVEPGVRLRYVERDRRA